MSIDVLLTQAGTLIRTADDVATLRQLILALAVQGKLVPQDAADEPVLNQYTVLNDLPFSIPQSWSFVLLKNVCTYGNSQKVESENIPKNAWLLDLEDIEKDTSRLLTKKTFAEKPSLSTKTPFFKGDVLYGKLRPYLNKVLLADNDGFCTTEIIPIRTSQYIAPNFLVLVLKSPFFIQYAVSKSYGMNLPRLGTNDAENAPIPLPPLAEQRRIVAKVDALMARCDELEALLTERARQQERVAQAAVARVLAAPSVAALEMLFDPQIGVSPAALRQTILALAVQGKLVPQDAADEPAQVLLGDIAQTLNGDRSSNYPSKDKRVDVGIPFINAGHLVKGAINHTSMDFISKEHYEILSGGKIQPGDILYCLRGSLGKCAIVKSGEFGTIASSLMIIRPNKQVSSEYLYVYLTSPQGTSQISKFDNGSAQPNLSAASVRKFPIPLPPLAEQRRIVAKVDALMALVDQLEAQQAQAQVTASALLEALVAGEGVGL
jgi:type I restriction enzyme S subunit